MPSWRGSFRRSAVPASLRSRTRCATTFPSWSAAEKITGPYSFYYWDNAQHKLLNGLPAYDRAIKHHYFSVVEIDPAENAALYTSVIRSLHTTPGYRLADSIPIDHWGRKTMQIWWFAGTGSH